MKHFIFVFLCSVVTSFVAKGAPDNYIAINDAINDLKQGKTEILDSNKVAILRRIQFNTGGAKLTSYDSSYLDTVSSYLKLIPTVKLAISGHTDNIGSYYGNLALSTRRAEAVKKYLVFKGIDPLQLESKGYGASKPMTDNNTSESRQKNRRVELSFVSNDYGNGKNGRGSGNGNGNGNGSGGITTITTNNGETIKASFFMFSPDGKNLIYQDKKSAPVKMLRIPDVRSIIMPDGSPFPLTKVPQKRDIEQINRSNGIDGIGAEREKTAAPKPVQLSPGATPAQRDSAREQMKNDIIRKVEEIKDFRLRMKKYTQNTFLFGFISLGSLNTKSVSGTVNINDGATDVYTTSFNYAKHNIALGVQIGIEQELTIKNQPEFYFRGMYQGGNNDITSYHAFSAGFGKILGKFKQIRVGGDVAFTRVFTDINTFTANNYEVENKVYNGTTELEYMNAFITGTPNISYEYKPLSLKKTTVRLTVGIPISARTGSGIRFKGQTSNGNTKKTTLPLSSEQIDYSINGAKQSSYTLTGFSGVYIAIGYVFK